MELFYTETKSGITYKLYAEQDSLAVRGNALASGDEDMDTKCENTILKRLFCGDIWAWCYVKVTAEIDGLEAEMVGTDYLGACSYASYKSFIRTGDCWPVMKYQAKSDLFGKLNAILESA